MKPISLTGLVFFRHKCATQNHDDVSAGGNMQLQADKDTVREINVSRRLTGKGGCPTNVNIC